MSEDLLWREINFIKNLSKKRKPEVDPALVEIYAILSAASFKLGAQAPTVANEGTFAVLQFSNARTEVAYVNWHVPSGRREGTDIKVAFYWAPTNGNAGHVAWEFDWEAVASESNETLGAGSTNVEVHDDPQSLDNELLETGYGTIAGASVVNDDTIGFSITRDHDDTDTYGAVAALVHVEIEYFSDRRGEPA